MSNGKNIRDKIFDRAPTGEIITDADFAVIGTGPSGATAAKVLTDAGHSVAMIEEGRWVKGEEFDGSSFTAQKKCYRELGTIAAMGKNMIPIIQGRCVGGGSVINAAIIWCLPEDVFERWQTEFKVGEALAWKDLEKAFEVLESDLHVQPVSSEVMGRNNALLLEGANKLGLESRIIPRNECGCQGLAQCTSGCPINAKQTTELTYVPWSLEKGARLYHSCRADRIQVEQGRARAVLARFEDPLTGEPRGKLTVHARKGIVVCATPIQTPCLLWRSGIGKSSGHLGRHFTAHPGAGLICIYPDEVRLWEGATQGWDSEHFRKDWKVKFEALGMHPDLLTSRIPGIGAEFKKNVLDAGRMGNVGCAIVCQAEGRVKPLGKSAQISYGLGDEDVFNLRRGLKKIAEIMVAAGAESLVPNIYGLPWKIGKNELKLLDDAPLDPKCYTLVMTHLFGTCRMGPDPNKSVVGLDFQVHDTKGVFILDSSIFPTLLGVNPQHTIMAVAQVGAKKIAAL
jgi:choline dehydrogenase-like flavoprotein